MASSVLSPISSFLRVEPIPSHNLSEQLLKLEKRYAVNCVRCHLDFKKIR